MSYKVLHIRPCEQSFSPRTNSACKYGARLVKEENLSQGGCFLFGSRVQALCSAGLSLPPASSKNYQAAGCSRTQSGFHRKVADKFDSTGATDCSKASSTDQRFGQPGIGGLADKKQSPWLSLKANDDRYAREKLAQVYRILVPAGDDPIQTTAEELSHEKERSHLCQSFLGSAAGTEHHR